MIPLERELQLHRFLARLRAKLGHARDPEQAARSGMRQAAALFLADAACLASVAPGDELAHMEFTLSGSAEWDLDMLGQFYRGDHPTIPANVLLAPLRRRERIWRVLALMRPSGEPFPREDRRSLALVAATITELVQRIDRERIAEVRSRIERKIMEELRPKDLFYQILHGLRSLTAYDHSSALLITVETGDSLRVAAEQIAWRKGKSGKVGLRLPIDAELIRGMRAEQVLGFDRVGEAWHAWGEDHPSGLAALVDYNARGEGRGRGLRESTMICAPIVTREGVIGVLKVASRHRGGLGDYEAKLVERFMPQVSVAIQNSRRAESLQANLLEAERKNAMADLARGVAHDMNNALGSILPLVQQLREDSQANRVESDVLSEDLQQIEQSMQVCRRIFGGMLSIARGAARGGDHGDVRRAVDNALAILRDGMQRRQIECQVDVPDDLPAIRCAQADLEQVFLNLMTNARDAMGQGGELDVGAQLDDAGVVAYVEDTGIGIEEGDLPRIYEPFFTTKPRGSGLGLSICRSILWGMGGSFTLRSRRGQGTRVELVLPIHNGRDAGEEG